MMKLLIRLFGLLLVGVGLAAAWYGFETDSQIRSWENRVNFDQSEIARSAPANGGETKAAPPRQTREDKAKTDNPVKAEGKQKSEEAPGKEAENQKETEAPDKGEGKQKTGQGPFDAAAMQEEGGRGMGGGLIGGRWVRSKAELTASIAGSQQLIEENKTARYLWFGAAVGGLIVGASLMLLPLSGKKKASAPVPAPEAPLDDLPLSMRKSR